MSRNVRFKLSEEEYLVVLQASAGLGVSVDVLAKQALAFTLSQARKLSEKRQTEHAHGDFNRFANPGDEDEAQQDSTSSLDKASVQDDGDRT